MSERSVRALYTAAALLIGGRPGTAKSQGVCDGAAVVLDGDYGGCVASGKPPYGVAAPVYSALASDAADRGVCACAAEDLA